MSKEVSGPTGAWERPRRAVDWFVENEAEQEPDRIQLQAWERWSSSPENRTQHSEVIDIHRKVGQLPRPALPDPDELAEDLSHDPDVSRIGPGAPASREGGRVHRILYERRHAMAGAAFGLIALAIAGLLWFKFSAPKEVLLEQANYHADVGQQRRISLPDGSQLTLGANSALTIRFSARAREVELERGEAFFRVYQDVRRPFRVRAADGTTTAIGTAFDIRRDADQVQVWVRDGTVEVAPVPSIAHTGPESAQATQWIPIRVAGGQQMAYTRHEASAPRAVDARIRGAWAEGRLVPLVYRGRPLVDVVEDVRLFTRRHIVVDPAVAEFKYSGVVRQEDVDIWLRALPAVYPLIVIDCREWPSNNDVPECSDPERILIRTMARSHEDDLRSAQR